MSLPEIYAAYPAVFCVGNEYKIMLPVKADCLMWVNVGEEKFCDHCNGVLKSSCSVHSVGVPTAKLDEAKSYTIVTRKVINRLPYFPEIEEEISETFSFRPVPSFGDIRIFCLSDSHSLVDAPVDAYRLSGGNADLLVLNGDVPNDSGKIEHIFTIYEIAGRITHGEIPVAFSRGNHDTRGIYAERFADFTPTDNGRSYFTFRVGSLWGIVLDCGEDKLDSFPEYGGTICCEMFRREETAFIKRVIAEKEKEYLAHGVKHKLVIAHSPFSYLGNSNPPFNIENDLFKEWTRLVSEDIRPELMLFGHKHIAKIMKPGENSDFYSMQTCDAIVSGVPNHKENTYTGASITLLENGGYTSEFVTGKG